VEGRYSTKNRGGRCNCHKTKPKRWKGLQKSSGPWRAKKFARKKKRGSAREKQGHLWGKRSTPGKGAPNDPIAKRIGTENEGSLGFVGVPPKKKKKDVKKKNGDKLGRKLSKKVVQEGGL